MKGSLPKMASTVSKVLTGALGGALVLLVVSGCGGAPVAAGPAAPSTAVSEDVTDLDELAKLQEKESGGWTQLELKVLEALHEGSSRPMGARYERDANRVVVTIWPLGEKLSESQLDDYRVRAEEVTGGIPVVIEIGEGDAPSEV